jgi:hypothetical protein
VNGSELRRVWRLNWLSAIQEFCDLHGQLAAWLNPNAHNRHFTFVELYECYLDDLVLSADQQGYPVRIAEGLLTEVEAAAVAKFHEVAASYNAPAGDDFDHVAILDDPAWLNVVREAQLARDCLASLILDPAERAALFERSEHAYRAWE